MWLADGMVDVADSKSAARKGVRVRVSGEPPFEYLKILLTPLFVLLFNRNNTQI
jgi:hypothetical protein